MHALLAISTLFALSSSANEIVICKADCDPSPGNSGGGKVITRSDVEFVEAIDGLQVLGTKSGVVIDVGSAGVVIDVGSAGVVIDVGSAGVVIDVGSAGVVIDVGSAGVAPDSVVIDVGSAGVVIDVGSAGLVVDSARDGLHFAMDASGWSLDDGLTALDRATVWFEPTAATAANLAVGGDGARLSVHEVELDTLYAPGGFAALQMDSTGLGELVLGIPDDDFLADADNELLTSATATFLTTGADDLASLQLRSVAVDSLVNFADIRSLVAMDSTVLRFANYGSITAQDDWECLQSGALVGP